MYGFFLRGIEVVLVYLLVCGVVIGFFKDLNLFGILFRLLKVFFIVRVSRN